MSAVGGPGGPLKAPGIWGQAGGGAEASVPTGAGHLLSRQNTKGKLGFNPIPGGGKQEEETVGGLCRGRCPSGRHIPEASPFQDTPSSWPHGSGPHELGLHCLSTISCVALGRLLNLSEPPFPREDPGGGDSHLPGLERGRHAAAKAAPCLEWALLQGPPATAGLHLPQ